MIHSLFFIFSKVFLLIFILRCLACVFVRHAHAVPWKPEGGIRSPGTGVTGGVSLHMSAGE